MKNSWGVFLVLICLFAVESAESATTCSAPGYTVTPDTTKCQPDLQNYLTTDFGFLAPNDESPVCGPGRVALSGDGNYTWTTFSSSKAPATTNTNAYASDAPYVYPYTTNTTPSVPVFGFPQRARCYCLGQGTGLVSWNPAPVSGAPSPYPALASNASTDARMFPVTFDVINTQDQNESQRYSTVPIAKDTTLDGRVFATFNSGASVCGCPNVNETTVINGGVGAGQPVGVNCRSAITAGPGRVLTPFDSTYHQTHVMNSAFEPTDGTGKFVDSIRLPSSGGDQFSLTNYHRKIWTCAAPYENNGSTCVFGAVQQPHHACDDGSGGGPSSPVSELVTGVDAAAKFNNVVNKKLACCMNSFRVTDTPSGAKNYEKYDCIDNTAKAATDFNTLWSGADDPADGGRTYALILRGGGGKVISGFYTLSGQHCDQFSEFAFPPGSSIKRYKLNPALMPGQQEMVGAGPVAYPASTDIPLPTSSDYSATHSKVTGGVWAKTYPKTADDYRSCPILVRAAMVASCPTASDLPAPYSAVNSGTITRCPNAASVTIHLRIEQVYEITGQPVQKAIDTLSEANQVSSLDISKIILNKYGDLCPPGTGLHGGTLCTY